MARPERTAHFCSMRPSERWGSNGSSKRASCPVLSYSVVSLEGAVRYGGPNLQHHMRSPRRPAHLPIRGHPAMKQPLHGAFGRRRRYWLRVVTRRRVVDDQFRLPGHVRLETTQEFNQDRGFFHDRYGGQAICRNQWGVEGFLNGTCAAARRNRDTGRWEDVTVSGRSDTAVVRSLRDGRRSTVAVRFLELHDDLGLTLQPTTYPSVPDLSLYRLRVA